MRLNVRKFYFVFASLYLWTVFATDRAESLRITTKMDEVKQEVQKYRNYLKLKWLKKVYQKFARSYTSPPMTEICHLSLYQQMTLCLWIVTSEKFRKKLKKPFDFNESRSQCRKRKFVLDRKKRTRNKHELKMTECPPIKSDSNLSPRAAATNLPPTYLLSSSLAINSVLLFETTVLDEVATPKAFVSEIDMKRLNSVAEFDESNALLEEGKPASETAHL